MDYARADRGKKQLPAPRLGERVPSWDAAW